MLHILGRMVTRHDQIDIDKQDNLNLHLRVSLAHCWLWPYGFIHSNIWNDAVCPLPVCDLSHFFCHSAMDVAMYVYI